MLLTGCSDGYARAPTIAATFEVSRANAASNEVEVAFDLAECTAVQDVLLTETSERVLVRLDIGGREGKACTDPLRRTRLVVLKQPLGDRGVYDAGVSPAQRVF